MVTKTLVNNASLSVGKHTSASFAIPASGNPKTLQITVDLSNYIDNAHTLTFYLEISYDGGATWKKLQDCFVMYGTRARLMDDSAINTQGIFQHTWIANKQNCNVRGVVVVQGAAIVTTIVAVVS